MRKYLLLILVIGSGICLIGRLFFLQVLDSGANTLENDNAIRKIYQYPKRGYIYDRDGKLLVANQPTYDVMVIPREVEPLDTLTFCALLKIDKTEFLKSLNRAKRYSPRLPSLFLSHLSKEDYAFLSEHTEQVSTYCACSQMKHLFSTSCFTLFFLLLYT